MGIPLWYIILYVTRVQTMCKLYTSIYGLQQASRQWNSKICKSLIYFDFYQLKLDYSLFLEESSDNMIMLLIYIDDIIISSSSFFYIEAVKGFSSTRFKLKDFGTLKYFIGLDITFSKQGIILSQRNYALQILEDVGFLATKPNDIYMGLMQWISLNQGKPLDDPLQYQGLIGRLICSTLSQPISLMLYASSVSTWIS